MTNEFFEFFTGINFPITMVVLVMAVLFLFIMLMLYIPTITLWIFPKFGYKKYSEYLPFKSVMSNSSIKLNDGSLVIVYKVDGVQTSNQDEKTKSDFLDLRTQLFNQIKDPNTVIRFYTVRDASKSVDKHEFDNPVLQKIGDTWAAQGLKIFNNTYYISLTVSGSGREDKLKKYANYIETILAPYRPSLLKNESVENFAMFMGRVLSPVTKPRPIKCDNTLSNVIAVDDVDFENNGLIKYTSGTKQLFSACVSFKISPDFLDEEFYNTAATLQCEMLIMNAFQIMGASDIDLTIRQTISTTDKNIETAEEQISSAQSAMDENVSGNQTLLNYYPLFVLYGNSEAELERNIEELKKIAAGFGISPVVENFASKVSWFSLIPGFNTFPRGFKMLSKTAAISIPISSMPRGVENSDWGPDPIVVFPTSTGTPYQFQFHVSDKPAAVAHTLTIGPSGGGKTTLFSFLISQSLRHPKLKSFFFDRNKGAEIFTLATGGKYITMQGKEKAQGIDFQTRLNPLKMEDSAANRAFLRRWFSMISEQGDSFSADEIARAVSVNYDYLDKDERMLKNLWESCFASNGKMRPALKKWIDPLQYGDIFNENEDTLDLNARLTTFDFTEILQDENLAPAVISYILHRINNTTVSGGNPSLIMIDETAPMLENKMFRDNFIMGLQEGRKNRQAYMVAFQRANVLDKLGIGDVVRGQAQTMIFFRNPAADENDYQYWNLNPLEMAFIRGKAYPNLKRAVLLSRPVTGESVILNTELGGLGSLLKLFESGRSSVLLAEELYKQYGNSFVSEYLKKQMGSE